MPSAEFLLDEPVEVAKSDEDETPLAHRFRALSPSPGKVTTPKAKQQPEKRKKKKKRSKKEQNSRSPSPSSAVPKGISTFHLFFLLFTSTSSYHEIQLHRHRLQLVRLETPPVRIFHHRLYLPSLTV